MADATESTQEQTSTSSAPESGSPRGIDSFPEEAQDYIRRLRAENAGHRNEKKTLSEQLAEYQNRDKTDQQRLEERAATAESGLTAAQTKLLRYEVAAEAGLPLKYANRLQGGSKDELLEDAKQLAQDFGIAGDGEPAGRPGGFDGGVRRPVTRPLDMNQLIVEKARRIN